MAFPREPVRGAQDQESKRGIRQDADVLELATACRLWLEDERDLPVALERLATCAMLTAPPG